MNHAVPVHHPHCGKITTGNCPVCHVYYRIASKLAENDVSCALLRVRASVANNKLELAACCSLPLPLPLLPASQPLTAHRSSHAAGVLTCIIHVTHHHTTLELKPHPPHALPPSQTIPDHPRQSQTIPDHHKTGNFTTTARPVPPTYHIAKSRCKSSKATQLVSLLSFPSTAC